MNAHIRAYTLHTVANSNSQPTHETEVRLVRNVRVTGARVDYRSYCTLGHVQMVEYETQDGCKFRPSTRKLSATQTLTHTHTHTNLRCWML